MARLRRSAGVFALIAASLAGAPEWIDRGRRYPDAMHESAQPAAGAGTAAPAAPPAALVGRRLLALFYDAFPVIALWLLLSALFTVGFTLAGHAERENIAPYSPLQWLLWLACWLATGAYAILSWRRGGQTLGMRPWRLRVVAADGGPATLRALSLRFVVGTASLLLGGLGFWWAWVDRGRLAWHDRASKTRIVRVEKHRRT